MMQLSRKMQLLFCMVLIVGLLSACNSGSVQSINESAIASFPTKPIKIIVHTNPGGPTDLMAREVARAAEQILGVSVIVENRPGGSGATQMAFVESSPADGYTLGAMTPSQIGLLNGNLNGQYDLDSFSWVSRTQIDPYIIVVHAESPFNTLDQLVEHLKASPNSLNAGGYGAIGSGHNIAWNIFAEETGVQANWTPYESTGDAVTALLGQHIDIANSNPGQVMQYVESGQLRILGVMAEERLEDMPDVPTYREAGYDVNTEWNQFRGIFGPAGIPEEILEKLSDAFLEAYQTEAFVNYTKNSNLLDGGMDYKEYTEYILRQDKLTKEWYDRLGVQ